MIEHVTASEQSTPGHSSMQHLQRAKTSRGRRKHLLVIFPSSVFHWSKLTLQALIPLKVLWPLQTAAGEATCYIPRQSALSGSRNSETSQSLCVTSRVGPGHQRCCGSIQGKRPGLGTDVALWEVEPVTIRR